MSKLFDGPPAEGGRSRKAKEARSLDELKNLDGKIDEAIEKVRTLKTEKAAIEDRVK